MDQKERDETLYRIDERTKQIRGDLKDIEERQLRHAKRIEQLESQTQKNRSDIKIGKGIVGFIAAGITAISTRLAGLFGL